MKSLRTTVPLVAPHEDRGLDSKVSVRERLEDDTRMGQAGGQTGAGEPDRNRGPTNSTACVVATSLKAG